MRGIGADSIANAANVAILVFMGKRVKILVVWNKESNTLHADVVDSLDRIIHSSAPMSGDHTFAEARWPAADWARRNGHTVGK